MSPKPVYLVMVCMCHCNNPWLGGGITCYGNKITIFGIKHEIIIDTGFSSSARLQNTCSNSKMQLYWIVYTVQWGISYVIQDQLSAVIELLSTCGSGRMLMSKFWSVEAVNISLI